MTLFLGERPAKAGWCSVQPTPPCRTSRLTPAVRHRGSSSRGEEFLDRAKNGIAVGDAATHDVLAVGQFVDVLVKLTAAVRAFNLAVAEEVQFRQQLFLENVDAMGHVVAPVVAVGKVE